MARNMNMAAFCALVKSSREQLEQARGADYEQKAVAKRLGMSPSGYSGIENGDIKSPPDPTFLSKISEELGLTVDEMVAAMGYPIKSDGLSESVRQRVILETPLADILHLKYNLSQAESYAAGLELAIEAQKRRGLN